MPNGEANAADRAMIWQGVSGRNYGVVQESLAGFSLRENHLYVIAGTKAVLWVGSTAELVADPQSRSRFRSALAEADRIVRLTAPTDEGARLSTMVDLEGGAVLPTNSAQAA